jgi:hypothetical protein
MGVQITISISLAFDKSVYSVVSCRLYQVQFLSMFCKALCYYRIFIFDAKKQL